MGYIQDCGRKLDDLLAARGASDETRDEIVHVVKRMVLESYQNGLGKKLRDDADAERARDRRASNRRPTRPRR